jgi:hypothetical protein
VRAQSAFLAETFEAALNIPKSSPETRVNIARKDAALVRYLMMRAGTQSCLESEAVRRKWLRQLQSAPLGRSKY